MPNSIQQVQAKQYVTKCRPNTVRNGKQGAPVRSGTPERAQRETHLLDALEQHAKLGGLESCVVAGLAHTGQLVLDHVREEHRVGLAPLNAPACPKQLEVWAIPYSYTVATAVTGLSPRIDGCCQGDRFRDKVEGLFALFRRIMARRNC